VNNSNDDLETYQRMVKPSRLKEIGQYLDEGGKFPTNIIINFKSDSELQFQPRQKFGDTATGMLTLPGLFGCAWIIDGQHRLYGYAYAERSEANEHSVVSVLAYENLPLKEEIRMFIDINTKQVKIRRGLVDEIVSGLNVDDQDHVNRLQALYANLALRLEKNPTSPLHKRINITGTEKTSYRCITSPSISDQSESANLLGKASRSTKSKPATFELGPLADPSGSSRAIIEKATATLSLYFGLFAHRLKPHWDLGDAKGGYLCTNNGLRPLIVLLAKVIDFIEQRENVRALNMGAAEIVERVQPYMEPLIEFFGTADPFMIAAFRNRGSSLKTVDDNCYQMMTIISQSISHFTTRDLEDFKGNRDAKGTQEAKLLIAEVNAIIFENVVATLQDAYGSDEKDWWMRGVPPAIRKKCDNKFNLTDGSSERWRQLSFENYPDIILWPDNWELFKDTYNFDGRRKRTDAVSWIDRINKAKAITDHAERGPLSPQEVDFVKRVYGLVKKHIEEEQKLDGKTRYLSDDAEVEPVLADVA